MKIKMYHQKRKAKRKINKNLLMLLINFFIDNKNNDTLWSLIF